MKLSSRFTPSKLFPRHHLDINLQDFAIALGAFLIPLKRQHLEDNIKATWSENDLFYPSNDFLDPHLKVMFSARTALDAILTHLALPANSEVLMTGINIKDFATIIQHHELKCRPLAFDSTCFEISSSDLERCITKRTKILIVAQLFGAVIDLERISTICRQYGILLIEDCAQAFCGKQYAGSPFSDFVLFSFGPIKSTTALGGSILICKSKDALSSIKQIESRYPYKSDFWFFKRTLKYLCLKIACSPRIYACLVNILIFIGADVEKTINQFSRGFSKENLIKQLRFQAPTRLLYLLYRRLKHIPCNHFSLRQKAAKEIVHALKPNYCFIGANANHNTFWVVPLLSSSPQKLQQELLLNGFDSTRGNYALHGIDGHDPSSELIDQSLYLPNLQNLRCHDKERLIRILNSLNDSQ